MVLLLYKLFRAGEKFREERFWLWLPSVFEVGHYAPIGFPAFGSFFQFHLTLGKSKVAYLMVSRSKNISCVYIIIIIDIYIFLINIKYVDFKMKSNIWIAEHECFEILLATFFSLRIFSENYNIL